MTMSTTLRVGRGEHHGPLTVFPIWRQQMGGPEVTLADAGNLGVSELAEPSVPHLQVTAAGRHPVLLIRQMVAVVDGMRIARCPQVAQTDLNAVCGPYELRGIADGDRLLHASVINREAWAE
jgi:hypothetical protein